MFATISFPILERIPLFGDAAVSPHGLGIAIGFLAGAVLLMRRAEKRGLGRLHVPDIGEAIQEMLGRAAIGAIVGARFFYVLTHLDVYSQDPLGVLRVWEGGLTFLGGLTGAVLFALPVMLKRGYNPAMVLDSAAPGIALGLIFGRFGDLVIGDHIGNPAGDFPLGWRCTGNLWDRTTNGFGDIAPRPYPFGAAEEPTAGCFDVALHQTALYDFLVVVVLLALMLWFERKPRFDGFFIALYVYGYGIGRFLTDFGREDRRFVGITGSQWAVLAAIAALSGWLLGRKPWRRPDPAWNPPDFDHWWTRDPDDAVTAVPEGGARSGGSAS